MEIINVTLDPSAMGSGFTLSNSNLTTLGKDNAGQRIRATHGKISGKWYWEVKIDSGSAVFAVGISSKDRSTIRFYYGHNGNKYPENVAYGTSLVVGNVIGIALDLDNGTLKFYKNGVSMGISHTNVKELGEVYPVLESGTWQNKTVTFNFGATPFASPIPKKFYSYDGRQYGSSHKILISSEDEFYSVTPEVVGAETAIPKMTSNTTPFGVASASSVNSSSYDAFQAFNGIQDERYGWASNSPTCWLQYQFLEPKRIYKYSISMRTSSTYYTNGEQPKDWTFEGSNDGINWEVLDRQVNNFTLARSSVEEYSINNNKLFTYYKINVSSNRGNATVTVIAELKMYEYTPSKLLTLPDHSEQTFINHGMNKDASIDLTTSKVSERKYVVQDNSQSGSGNVYKQKIDTTKIPIKSAMIE